MNGRKVEFPHNTPEQARGYLIEALAIVEELDVPDDLRSVAFVKAVDLVSAKSIQVEQVAADLGALLTRPGL